MAPSSEHPKANTPPASVSTCPESSQIPAAIRGELDEAAVAELLSHAEACESCANCLAQSPIGAELEDDLKWADELWQRTPVDINVTLTRLNQYLPNYEITRELGRGGMGIVFEARDLALDRRVALKVLPALLGAVRPEAQARFHREASLVAKLEHTNIISVYDFGEVDGTCFYAMQLINGPSLRTLLREVSEAGAIDVVLGTSHTGPAKSMATCLGTSSQSDRAYFRQIAAWIADAAAAAHYAHERGVIHRDIKPANLLLSEDQQIMIADFGLARCLTDASLTQSKSVIGTMRYASPEQVDGSGVKLDARVDVYALGATLYELLTLRPLFSGSDDRELLSRVLNEVPIPPRRLIEQVPVELENICLKAIGKNRDDRYQTAQDMADDLRRYLLDLPVLARRAPTHVRAWKFLRRNKAISLTCALTVTMMALAASYSTSSHNWRNKAESVEEIAADLERRILEYELQTAELSGDVNAALDKIHALLKHHPNNMRLQCIRARLMYQSGSINEAVASLEGILAQHPECFLPHAYLAGMVSDPQRVLHHRETARALLTGDDEDTAIGYALVSEVADTIEEAIGLLDEGLQSFPNSVSLYIARCGRLTEVQRHEEALLDAERATAMRPMWGRPHGMRGLALLKLQRFEDAARAFSRAIELDEWNINYWADRARCYTQLRKYDQALLDTEQALVLADQQNLKSSKVLGTVYSIAGVAKALSGDRAGAIKAFEQAATVAPNESTIYFDMSVVAANPADRIAAATRAIELEPDNPANYHNRAVGFAQSGNYEAALADRSKVVELQPTARNYHFRALACIEAARFEEAIEDLTFVIDKQPRNWTAGLRRGLSLEAIGDERRADRDYQRVIAMNVPASDYAIFLQHTSSSAIDRPNLTIEDRFKDLDRPIPKPDTQSHRLYQYYSSKCSAEELLTAVKSDTEKAEAHFYIGRDCLNNGSFNDAKQHFQNAKRLDPRGLVIETRFVDALPRPR